MPDTTTDTTSGTETGGTAPETGKQAERTFTQAEVDQIVKDRAERLYKQRVGDVDIKELKARAEGAKTAEDRIADLEKQVTATQHEALRRRVQAAHGITDEDAALFLTGADEDALTAQAKRLAGREAGRKKQGNRAPSEGNNPPSGDTGDDREFVRRLFGAKD